MIYMKSKVAQKGGISTRQKLDPDEVAKSLVGGKPPGRVIFCLHNFLFPRSGFFSISVGYLDI
jgi:hypothetical protein